MNIGLTAAHQALKLKYGNTKPWKRRDICLRGHDMRITGRQPNSRNCRICMSLRSRKKQSGCTPEQFSRLFTAQTDCCAICQEFVGFKKIHVDHDHKTGVIRGLLCARCNVGLGSACDFVERLDQLADYLIRNKGPKQ